MSSGNSSHELLFWRSTALEKARSDPVRRQHNVLLALLLALAAMAWAILGWFDNHATMERKILSSHMGLRALLIIALWVVMSAQGRNRTTDTVIFSDRFPTGQFLLSRNLWFFLAPYERRTHRGAGTGWGPVHIPRWGPRHLSQR